MSRVLGSGNATMNETVPRLLERASVPGCPESALWEVSPVIFRHAPDLRLELQGYKTLKAHSVRSAHSQTGVGGGPSLTERDHGLPHAGLYTQPRWLNTRVSPLITAGLSEAIPVSGNVLRHLPCSIQRTLDSSSAGECCYYFHLAIQKLRLGR